MSSKPLVIMYNDPDLEPFISRFQHNRNEKEKLFKSIEKEFLEGMQKLENQKFEYWQELKEILFKKGIIDSKDLNLSYNNGVIYIEGLKEEEIFKDISLKNIVTKFIK